MGMHGGLLNPVYSVFAHCKPPHDCTKYVGITRWIQFHQILKRDPEKPKIIRTRDSSRKLDEVRKLV
jgi:hypothetical protein